MAIDEPTALANVGNWRRVRSLVIVGAVRVWETPNCWAEYRLL